MSNSKQLPEIDNGSAVKSLKPNEGQPLYFLEFMVALERTARRDPASGLPTSTPLPDSLQQLFSNSSSKSSTPTAAPKATSPRQTSLTTNDSFIEVNPAAYQLPLDPSARPNAKLKNKYVLTDGSVVNGKGLGRGRPGIKRGSRKSTLSEEIITIDDNDSVEASDRSSKLAENSASGKRKRSDSDLTSNDSSKESTPEYNPTSTQTRSGRQSNKPIPIIVPATATASPAAKRPALTQNISSPSIKKHPKIKAKVYRGREQFALCEHCLRGNGPPGNAIVFCDACNKCWHQRCHDPKIPRHVVADTKAEWFCADCDRILHGKKKLKTQPPKPVIQPQPQPQTQMTPPAPPASSAPSTNSTPPSKPLIFGAPITAAGNLTLAQQKAYLNSLTKDKLIEIVLKAAALAPLLPIMETPIIAKPPSHTFIAPPRPIPGQLPYPPPPTPPQQQQTPSAPPQPIPQFTSNYTTPVDKAPVFSHSTVPTGTSSQAAVNEDEGYFDDFDEHGELYPKPGEGAYNLALPPESGDLGILLEGPDCKTFSHWLKSSGAGYKKTVDGIK